jgi:hypothetical protein
VTAVDHLHPDSFALGSDEAEAADCGERGALSDKGLGGKKFRHDARPEIPVVSHKTNAIILVPRASLLLFHV